MSKSTISKALKAGNKKITKKIKAQMPLEKIHISNSFFFFFLGEKNPITTNVFSY